MNFKKENDHHWDFLEEIEAPMWVDLRIEAKFVHHNVDENWFLISHLIHQSSASQIKASYKQTTQGHAKLLFELEGPSSPKLPYSLSRSRGKDYRSKNMGVESKSFVSNKQHPIKRLGGKTINGGLGSRQQAESKTNGRNSKLSRDCGRNSTRSTVTDNSETIPCTGDFRKSLHQVTSKVGERKLMSSHQQQKSSAMSSQTVSGTTELFLATRIGLRKSCVSRQASRVEFNDGRRVIGRQSSSGKSSVGTSSSLGYNILNKELTKEEVAHRTPDIGSVMDDFRLANTQVKSDVSRASTSQLIVQILRAPKLFLLSAHNGDLQNQSLYVSLLKEKLCFHEETTNKIRLQLMLKQVIKFQVSKINKCVAADKENALPRRLGTEERVTTFQFKLTEPKK